MMTLKEFLAEWHDDNDRLLVHTSGSTGVPKPMWVEKRRMLASARITCDFLGLEPGDSALLCMKLDYIAGKMMVVRSVERQLRLTCVKPSGHPLKDVDWSVFEHSGPTLCAMVPLQVYNSLQVPEERQRLMLVKHLIIGGGAIDDKLADALKSFPNYVWSSYGMTETLSHIALRRLNGPDATPWYEPFEGVTVSVNHEGCLCIDAPAVAEKPLVTNDIAEIRKKPVAQAIGHGETVAWRWQFRILGRKDNVICSGGIKIQIEEVEAALRPFLRAPFAITKRKNEKFGEIVVLLTEQKDLAEVSEICMNALPKYWIPRDIRHVEAIPMTETGKIARAKAEALAR